MQSFPLDKFLSGHVFAFLLLLSRMGAIMMLFPGIGERYVSMRTRMIFSCLICLLLLEPMIPSLPAMPLSPFVMGKLLVIEVIIGIFFGTLVRVTFGILESAGMIIGAHTGLSNATMMNPAMATQSPLPSAFLSTAGLTLVFATGLDHYTLKTSVALYNLFPVGGALITGDMSQLVIKVTNQSFIVGIELAAPFLIVGLLLYAALGVVQKLLPSVQLFMVMMPIEIWGGLALFSLTISGILTVWLSYFDRSLGSFFQG